MWVADRDVPVGIDDAMTVKDVGCIDECGEESVNVSVFLGIRHYFFFCFSKVRCSMLDLDPALAE